MDFRFLRGFMASAHKESKEVEISLSSLSKNLNWIVLAIILIFGFYLRVYHLDYPVIGYHNWKETHYLTESRNFARDGFFENGFFIPSFDYINFEGDQTGAHSDSIPTLSIIIAIFFSIFG